MSHFVVTVAVTPAMIAEHGTAENAIVPLLAPYHEFECTGFDDEYVVEVDKFDEAKEEYAKNTTIMIKQPDGSLVSPYGDDGNFQPQFSETDGDALFPRRRMFVPAGYEEVRVPRSEVESFAEWIEGWYGYSTVGEAETPDFEGKHKYGYTRVADDGTVLQVVDRTNPNKKWDWYVVGGRWEGYFDGSNTVAMRDWDIDAKIAEGREKGGKQWDAIHEAVGDEFANFRPWREFVDEVRASETMDMDGAREAYRTQPAMKLATAVVDPYATAEDLASYTKGRIISMFGSGLEDFNCSREEYVERRGNQAVAPFALLDEDGWHQRGEMGWWGMVSDADDDWAAKAVEKLRSYDPDTVLVAVDCHI